MLRIRCVPPRGCVEPSRLWRTAGAAEQSNASCRYNADALPSFRMRGRAPFFISRLTGPVLLKRGADRRLATAGATQKAGSRREVIVEIASCLTPSVRSALSIFRDDNFLVP